MADIEKWITVNGVHIPIMKGESKARAVGRFIKHKQRNKQMERYNERNDKYLNGDRVKYDKDERLRQANAYMENKYGKNWDKRSDINIKGEGTQKYKEKLAKQEFTKARNKYDKIADDIENEFNKSYDDYKSEYEYKMSKGDWSGAKTTVAKREYDAAIAKGDAIKARGKGEYLGRQAYENRMKSPMRYKLKVDKTMTNSEKVIWDNAVKTAKAMADKNTDVNALAERIYNRNIKTKKNDKAYKKAARNDRKRSYGDTSGSRNTYRS